MIRPAIWLTILAAFIYACQSGKDTSKSLFTEEVAPLYDPALRPFYHGVASGDPLADRVIIWTRVTPTDSAGPIPVEWQVSENESFDPILISDTVSASPLRDYTVKVDVDGLSTGKNYFYRFRAYDKVSPVGKTKTLGRPDSLKLAVVSCSNWEFGYFNAYGRIAEKELDAVIHLGDYIYEYGQGGYGNKNSGRLHLPAHEIVTLADYRTRYSQYHLDADLREARRKHPFITIWDDHEVANDSYSAGAGNHQPDKEGDYDVRKAAARQAYYEWLPIRESETLYRSFFFGDFAALIMLDERLQGRTEPVDSLGHPAYDAADRSMLGKEQLAWFERELESSGSRWKIIGNQVIFTDLDLSAVSPGRPRNLDSWDGYPAEKKRIAAFIREKNIGDVIFLTGDTHSSWAFEVAAGHDRSGTSRDAFAVELGTTSVSSSNSNEHSSDEAVKERENKLLHSNPHLKFTNHRDHGYLLLSLYPERARAEWFYVETLLQRDAGEFLGKRLEIRKGTHHLE